MSIDRQMALAREWDTKLAEVRAVPGFADFLRPPKVNSLLPAAEAGPVVVVNVGRRRCDALIVTVGEVEPVALPNMTFQAVADRSARYLHVLRELEDATAVQAVLRTAIRSGGTVGDLQRAQAAERVAFAAQTAAEKMLTDLLEWLWDSIAQPVLGALNLDAQEEPTTRLWWCPTGALALLPLHAAGHHQSGGADSVIDRVVSSHTPSIRALCDARTPRTQLEADAARCLVVGVAQAPGQLPLEGADDELSLLADLLPAERRTRLSNEDATCRAVLDQMTDHRWAHFSCHGDQNLANPSTGGLALYDGVLTVRDIAGRRFHADFAALSACKTAVGGVGLPDEAITLASALHYAGYRHVIGTLWSVYDKTGTIDVFRDVYQSIVEDGVIRAERSALALHRATRKLRDANRSDPSIWTPFVHIGP